MTSADALPSVHDPTVAATQPNAMVNDAGDVFYPDSAEDAALFASWHDARPVTDADARQHMIRCPDHEVTVNANDDWACLTCEAQEAEEID